MKLGCNTVGSSIDEVKERQMNTDVDKIESNKQKVTHH